MGISGQNTAYAAEKPAYLKSVTYFGDEWPINYWGSEDEMIKLCEKIEKIDGVSYCECNWDDETGDYNFWGTVEVNLGDD